MEIKLKSLRSKLLAVKTWLQRNARFQITEMNDENALATATYYLNKVDVANVLEVEAAWLQFITKNHSNILESTVGDKGSIKSDKDFNLIMTGLLIAAGAIAIR